DESFDSEFEAKEADDELEVEEAGAEPEDHATKTYVRGAYARNHS
nr:hypothetical protein [Tanacetum cinerariifolium]